MLEEGDTLHIRPSHLSPWCSCLLSWGHFGAVRVLFVYLLLENGIEPAVNKLTFYLIICSMCTYFMGVHVHNVRVVSH